VGVVLRGRRVLPWVVALLLACGGGAWAAAARPDTAAPLRGAVVLIDPGHGGVDGGAVAPDRTLEKDLVLELALRLRAVLEADGAVPYLTRSADVDPSGLPWNQPGRSAASLRARVHMVVRTGASVFISLHLDSTTASTETRRGPDVFYGPDSARNPAGRALAQALQGRFHRVLGVTDKTYPLNVYVLRASPVPAALVEAAFLNNPEDLARIRNPTYQQALVQSIAAGIADFLRTHP
jgi:N-acetylmuramoyl-L-alanine amidase